MNNRQDAVPLVILAAGCLLLIFISGCSLQVQKKALHRPDNFEELHSLDGKSPWLKVHMPDGGMYLLSGWNVDEGRREIRGQGSLFNARRDKIAMGPFAVSLDSVAIIESNVVQTSNVAAGLTVLTVATVGVAIYCLTNPKACFGSCPTFYLPDDQGKPRLVAEGFSASVAPGLEDTDLDALFYTGRKRETVNLTMTNEALETHVVRRVDLLAAPCRDDARILAAQDGTYWQVGQLLPANHCRGPEGDCTALLAACDDAERTSLADSLDLGAKEYLDLEFETLPEGELGLVIASRHSLLSTYLFYQGLAYLGQYAAPSLARVEGSPESQQGSETLGHLLGKIEVQVPGPPGTWRTVGEMGETGPLAISVHMLRLPELGPAESRIRLRLTKGNWRLDYAALAVLGRQVRPVRIAPTAVLRGGVPDPQALADLTRDDRTLITLPGDRFDLSFALPDTAEAWEVFLESRGYYLEWMREEWMAEEDPALAALMFTRPRLALGFLAPKFKALEPDMESQFWGSRYAH